MKKNMTNRGFTLIEILIVMAIIGIFSTFAVVNFRQNDKTDAVKNAAQTVLTGLKEVQTMALSGALSPSGQTPSWYYFQAAPCPTAMQASPCLFVLKAQGSDLNEELVKTAVLAKDIKIANDINPAEYARVFFQPPRGNMYIGSDASSDDSTAPALRLRISHADEAAASICVFVSQISGKIYTGACPE